MIDCGHFDWVLVEDASVASSAVAVAIAFGASSVFAVAVVSAVLTPSF